MYSVPQVLVEMWGIIQKTGDEHTLVTEGQMGLLAEMVLQDPMVKMHGLPVKVVDMVGMVVVEVTESQAVMVKMPQASAVTVGMVHMEQREDMVLMEGMVETAFLVIMLGTAVMVKEDPMDPICSLRSDPSILLFTLTKHWYIQKSYPN